MHKLRCGIIYTNAFADYLANLGRGKTATRHKVLAIDYVRASSGPKKGSEWWKLDWMPTQSMTDDCIFQIGGLPVGISRQTQRGLKNRCLDWRDGQVVIKS
jgi:hypothetical protein